jgi:hypothetical protein
LSGKPVPVTDDPDDDKVVDKLLKLGGLEWKLAKDKGKTSSYTSSSVSEMSWFVSVTRPWAPLEETGTR